MRHTDLADTTSQTDPPGVALRKAREALGLSRPDVEKATGTDAHSLYRWEQGRRTVSAADFNRLMRYYQMQRHVQTAENALERDYPMPKSSDDVPRGTSDRVREAPPAVTPPRELRVMALRFEAEALELGADDSDLDHIREVLRSAAESTMGARGYQENASLARTELELHIAMLREWLAGRIEHRKRQGVPRTPRVRQT